MGKSELFCVWAYRYGDVKGYNYPVGIFQTLESAKQAAQTHHEFRGGKYDHRIYCLSAGAEYDAEDVQPVYDSTQRKEDKRGRV